MVDNKKNSPKVSVIIPCYNLGLYVEDAINSVLNQTFQDFEIIVVNDGSTDAETLKILKALNKPKTKILNTINQGLPNARNNGIDISNGQYICCLDADDMLEKTFLEKTVEVLDKDTNNKIGFVTTWVQHFGDEDWIWKTSDYDPLSLALNNNVHVSSLFRRESFEKAGRYKKMMESGYEDWNLWISIIKNGYKWDCIHKPLFLYRKRGKSMINKANDKRFDLYKNLIDLNQDFYKNHFSELLVLSLKKFESLSTDYHYSLVENQNINNLLAKIKDLNKELENQLTSKEQEVKNNLQLLLSKQIRIEQLEGVQNDLNENLSSLYAEREHLKNHLHNIENSKLFKLRSILKNYKLGPIKIFKISYILLSSIIPFKLRRIILQLKNNIKYNFNYNKENIKENFNKLKKYYYFVYKNRIEIEKFAKKYNKAQLSNFDKKVSVIMLSFNRFYDTKRAIKYLYKYTNVPFELIILDNNSRIDVKDKLKKFCKKYNNIKLIFENINLGCAGGRKEAFKYASGDYLFFVDNDIIVMPYYLENLLLRLINDSSAAAVCCKVIFPDKRIQFNGCQYEIEDNLIYYSLMDSDKQFNDINTLNNFKNCKWIPGGATLWRSEIFAKFPVDENMQGSYEDNEVCMRLQKAGYNLLNSPHSLVVHYHMFFKEENFHKKEKSYIQGRYNNERIKKALITFYKKHNLILISGSLDNTWSFLSNRTPMAITEFLENNNIKS